MTLQEEIERRAQQLMADWKPRCTCGLWAHLEICDISRAWEDAIDLATDEVFEASTEVT